MNTPVEFTTKNTASLTLGIISAVFGALGLLICWIPFLGALAIPVAGLGILLALIGCVLALAKGKGWGMPGIGAVVCLLAIGIAYGVTNRAAVAVNAAIAEHNKTAANPSAFHSPELAKKNEAAERKSALDKITVEDLSVRINKSFIPSLEADFSVVNRGVKAVKDFVVTVYIHGSSGTVLGEESITLYDVLNPGEALDYKNQRVGATRSQGASYTAAVTNGAVVD